MIPLSVTPNAHPPGVPAYLAAVWTFTGYSMVSTRTAMLVLATLCVLVVFLLAIELCGGVKGAPAFAVLFVVVCSPTFYAQALLPQLYMPVMLPTLPGPRLLLAW